MILCSSYSDRYLKCYPNDRQEIVGNPNQGVTRQIAYQRTLHYEKEIIKAGYNLVVLWEHDQQHWTNDIPEIKSHTYPNALVYDFESYFDKTAYTKPTPDLTFECNHIPISVSVGSTLTKDVFI